MRDMSKSATACQRRAWPEGAMLCGLLALAALVGGVSSCGGSVGAKVDTETPGDVAIPIPTPPTPVKIALMFDKTGSANYTRTPEVTTEELNPLFDLLRDKGGELGVGLISDDSNRSLLRLRVSARPGEPVLSIEEPKVGELDTHELAERKRKNAALKASLDKARRRAAEERKAWEGETGRRLEVFTAGLRELLETPPAFPASDVWGAIQRAELFLGEDDADWPQPARRYLVLISDAQHNTSGRPVALLKSGAKLIVVNGSASVGSLGQLTPKMFESAQAAFRHIVSTEVSQK